jgi:RND family efflux transporter, MFP subunit
MKRVVLVILAMVIMLTGCGASGQTDKSSDSSSKVQASNPVFVMAGVIDANDKVGITSKISARVTSINAEVGTVVKQGDTLVTFDTKDLQAQVAQAQAGVNTAEANLLKTQAGARPEQIAQAQAAVDSAKTSYLNAKNNYDRSQQLAAAGAISQSQLESAQTQLAALQASYSSAQDQLDMLTKGETQETINVLQAQVKQAQAALDLAKTQLSNGTLVSPISGTVSAKNINVGELASPGVTLVSIVNNSTLFVQASLPDGLANSVKVGQAVIVKVADIPDKEFTGKISVIDPVIDSRSRSVLVKTELNNPNSVLKPGMLAEIGLKK